MTTPERPAVLKQLRNHKGFTLIEMAIVLVIIGIIIGAVVKGQDLVENAKAKQFTSKIQAWQIALSTYYDRKGKYPGANTNGFITADAASSISAASFVSAPEQTFVIGGTSFSVYLGADAATPTKNYLCVAKPTPAAYNGSTSSSDLTALKFFEAYDTAVDGTANPSAGAVIGATTVTATGMLVTAVTAAATTVDDWVAATSI